MIIISHPKDGAFHTPRVRQYMRETILHREEEERKTTWNELFFDLIFVGAISQLGIFVEHHLDGSGFLEYVVKFAMIWRVWSISVGFINRYMTNDLALKLYLLLVGCLAIGLSLNISTVGISDYFLMFYLIFQGVNLLGTLIYAFFDFRFMKAQIFIMGYHLITFIPQLSAIFIEDKYSRTVVLGFVTLFEILSFMLAIQVLIAFVKPKYVPAINIEHWSERFGLFTIIVLGEVIIAILIGKLETDSFLLSILGMSCAAAIQWIYFDVDSAKQYTHAVRRSKYTAMLWQVLHLPLHISIAFSGACMALIATEVNGANHSEYAKNAEVGYIVAQGCTLFFMSIIGLLHKSLDEEQNRVLHLSKRFRIFLRIGSSFVLFAFAIIVSLYSYHPQVTVGLNAILFLSLVAVEEYGKIEKK
eukprot:NODE_618_length_5352_cov_0.421854.p2 type:complete len:416 gc:universal NODE_618_length_5352_cov_0.421854:4281-3034(-)